MMMITQYVRCAQAVAMIDQYTKICPVVMHRLGKSANLI